MEPKTKFFDWIDDYCLKQLSESDRLEFEVELMYNSELREEVNLHKDIQSAISEKEVINLREKLERIVNQENADVDKKGTFGLLDDFVDIQDLKDTVSSEDLINFYDSLPKMHVYQHELVSNENIHEFYKEQNKSELNGENDSLNGFDFNEFDGLEEAIQEKDIINLRETLNLVSKSIKPQFSAEEIDNYVNGELDSDERKEFEKELAQNSSLKAEVELHREMQNAIQEEDIFNLRNQLNQIMETETSWSVGEHSIEDFIDDVLEGEILDNFKDELLRNSDLKAELNLRKDINEAIGEKDIFALREELKKARDNAGDTELKSIVPSTNIRILNYWKHIAAIAVILIGITGFLNNEFQSFSEIYDSNYNSPEWSPERSVTTEVNYLNEGNIYFINGKYKEAIELYDKALKEEGEKFVIHFYKGASLQNMNNFQAAIPEYNQVLTHGDNMYMEEAEWNKILCYIKLGEKDFAKNQLLAIINRNGFYKKDAKAILRRLKYSVK